MARPRAPPITGPVVSPAALAAVQKNRVVSRPSRATARNAVSASAPAPRTRACSTFPDSSPDRLAAVRDIQKIIAVTSPTARMLSNPPTTSWPMALRELVVELSTAAKLADTVSAPSTPSHIGAVTRRPCSASADRWTAASKMLTTSPASSPSRRPMSKLGIASDKTTQIRYGTPNTQCKYAHGQWSRYDGHKVPSVVNLATGTRARRSSTGRNPRLPRRHARQAAALQR
ncbi:Uncharacterised protein [Mycobacteroides abscessus]|nr:Uncharacterised protein [Mycobacteroides abscessus]